MIENLALITVVTPLIAGLLAGIVALIAYRSSKSSDRKLTALRQEREALQQQLRVRRPSIGVK